MLAPMGARSESARRSLTQQTLAQIEERLAPALPHDLFEKPAEKHHSRERIFSLARTFWSWIWQVFQSNTSCREVVRQVQALFAAFSSLSVDEGTSAYCKARQKIALSFLEKAFAASARSVEKLAPSSQLQGRPQKVVDGSGCRLWDSSENREAFPPPRHQFSKPCFPHLKILALFSAASGAILAKAAGALDKSELRLLFTLGEKIAARDILIGDRHFGCFVVAAWLQQRGADLIARVSSRNRKIDFGKASKSLGQNDACFVWRKPANPSPALSREEWAALPEELTVRVVQRRIEKPGFRTVEVTLVTTLLDAKLFPADEIGAAYLKRWRLEMCLDDLKTSLGMEMLSCRCPDLVEKELLVFLTAHNLLRWLMAQAALAEGADLERLSFKGSLDAFRQWSSALVQIRSRSQQRKRRSLWQRFFQTLVADQVPLRPERKEPRAVKKRSKYPPLDKPRGTYVDRPSRTKRRRLARAKAVSQKQPSLK
jgi:hypothetical protein